MKNKIAIPIAVFSILILLSLILRPVPILPEDELIITRGTVSQVFEGGEKDICFRLEGSNEQFYINRGLERGLELNALKTKLIGREITIKYPKYWSLLGNGKTHHLSKLEYRGETLFTELGQ